MWLIETGDPLIEVADKKFAPAKFGKLFCSSVVYHTENSKNRG